MERIKEAISKAKAAQQNITLDQLSTSSIVQTNQNPTTTSSEISGNLAFLSTPIQYKQTRVVELDPAHLERNRIVSFTKTDVRTISFDRLRTQLLAKMQENNWRTIAITSPTASCGKTTTAVNLALSIAHQTEQTVLLADLDLRNPKVADYLGLPEAASLVDYLNGDAELAAVFVNPSIPRLTLLPNHKAIENSAEIIMTSRVKDLVSDMRERYKSRLVIFDLPPLLTTDDALAFLPHVDCVLVVIENGVTTKSQVRDAFRLLQNAHVVGTVLNKGELSIST